MSDSGLITYSAISPNCNRPRRYPISKITPHHMAGNLSLKQIAEIEGRPARRMSSNYAIASNGDIALLCHEADRSWCSSSPENDHRAITIEVANDQIGGNWHVSDAAFESLIALCVDICQRNPALASGLNYTGDARGNLTKHSYFKNTACPGPYLGSRFGDLAKEVNRRLLGNQQEQQETELRAGMALHLTGTSLFAASTSQIVAGTRAGTYYLWGSAIVNGRVRITNSTANVGKSRAGLTPPSPVPPRASKIRPTTIAVCTRWKFTIAPTAAPTPSTRAPCCMILCSGATTARNTAMRLRRSSLFRSARSVRVMLMRCAWSATS